MLKYCFFSVAIVLIIPIIIGLSYQLFTDEPKSVLTFYKNSFNDIAGNEIFISVQVIILLIGIWIFGGISGRLIINKEKSRFRVSVMTILLLWILIFISSTLSAAIENTITWGIEGFGSAIKGWLIYGLFPFLILGIIHGLTMGYFFGREVNRKGDESKGRHANTIYSK